MTDRLDVCIETSCDIADALPQEGKVVPIAWLKRYCPRGCSCGDGKTGKKLSARALLVDAAGVAMERIDDNCVRLRWRSRDTGMVDQAVRIREAFAKKLFRPGEHVSRAALTRLGRMGRAGTTDCAGALAEALETVGFKSLGTWATKWNRRRLLIPEAGISLTRGASELRLADARQVAACAAVPADELLCRHFPHFAKYTCAAQRDVIRALLSENGLEVVIARLPTGSGKSLLYLLPSAEWRRRGEPATSIIVSPVIALQNDQMRKIREHYEFAGLEGAELNSTVGPNDRTTIYRKLRAGKLDALFLSPEKLVDPFFQQILIESAEHIRLFVVDEAHIVAEWGQDFRTDFFRLGVVRNRLRKQNPDIHTLLLSATLTADSERSVLQVFQNPERIARFDEPSLRTELSIRVVRHLSETERDATLLKLLPHVPRPCIVYCARREHVKALRKTLRSAGIWRFLDYMGSTAADYRPERLEAFHNGDVDFVLATNAFGLGVDKADVRSVIHYDVPRNLDEYYQQIGRAARDHWTGHAFLLDSPASRGRATRDKLAIIKTETAAARAQTMLSERVELPADGSGGCLIPLHARAEHIAEPSALNRKWNFAVLNILEQVGDVDVDRAVLRHVWVRRGDKPQRLDQYPQLKKALKNALSKKSGAQIDLAAFAIRDEVSFSQLEQDLVIAILDRAVELVRDDETDDHEREEWVLAHRHGASTWTRLHTHRLDEHRRQRLALVEKQRRELIQFLSGRSCRMRAFEKVYGYELDSQCGHCDVCDKALAVKPVG